MIPLLTFLISLVLAFMALRGWPADGGLWTRPLLALAFLMAGAVALFISNPLPRTPELSGVRGRGMRDAWISGLCLALMLGILYAILSLAPPVAGQFSRQMGEWVQAGFAAKGDSPQNEDELLGSQVATDVSYEVGAMFDPNGAVVPRSADLKPSREPAVSLKFANRQAADQLRRSGQIYLHLFSHHEFDGERWTSPSSSVPRTLAPAADGWIYPEQDRRELEHEYTILHHQLSNGLDALSSLQGLRRVRLPELMQLNPGTWLLPLPDNPLGIIRPYQAGSSPKRFQGLLERGLPIEAGEPSEMHLAASTDASLNARVQDLADSFRQHPDLATQLIELKRWLSTSFGYTLNLNFEDKDKSALESFLQEPGTNEGFCVHFASAAVLILRELGVPARVSYGWTGGEYYAEENQFVFGAADGHAWAEIFLKDHGWVVFESTPATGLPQIAAAAAGTPPPKVETLMDEEKKDRVAHGNGAPAWLHWLWLALGGGAAITIILVLMGRRETIEDGPGLASAGGEETPGYLQLFYKTCARMGCPKPVGDTLSRHLEQLDQQGISVSFADELLRYHYGITYREASKDARFEKRLRAWIKAL